MKKLFNKKDIKIILACFSLVIVVLFYFFYIYDRKDYYICKDSKDSVVTLILDVPKKRAYRYSTESVPSTLNVYKDYYTFTAYAPSLTMDFDFNNISKVLNVKSTFDNRGGVYKFTYLCNKK